MYFDTHAHYYDEAFDTDRDALLSGLPDKGVELVLCPGVDAATSRVCVELAQRHPNVYAAVGYHPEDLDGVERGALDEIEAMARHPKVKAIGEIGLDYYWEKDAAKREKQKDFFAAQLALAEKLNLPAIVHDREAHKDSVDMVRAHPGARGVFHCYAGGVEDAKFLVERGWMLSFTGAITFKNARKAPEVLRWLPPEHIMIETDAPYMAPEPFRGKRCDSAQVYRVAETIAEIKGMTTAALAEILLQNSKRFFDIKT